MTDRPRPGDLPDFPDHSLLPGEIPSAGDLDPARRLGRATGEPDRLTADVMTIGSWHEPAQSIQPGCPQPPSADSDEPGTLAGTGEPHGRAGGVEPGSLAGVSAASRAEVEAAFGAGFTYRADRDRADRDRADRDRAHGDGAHGDGSGPGGNQARGFAAGGVLGQMLPGAELGCYLSAARRAGFERLSDTELCGVIAAYDRQTSCDTAGQLAAVAEFDARRATPEGRPGEHADDEIAALLTLTGRGAADLTGLARDLARLPQTSALLANGIINPKRATLIATHLSVLSDEGAAAVEAKIAPRAGRKTTGELGAALTRAVKAHDPQAAARRRRRAQKDARVEVWAEPSGTAALAGRDLPPAGVIEATKSLDADARWLKAHGAAGSFDQLRAKAFAALLAHKPLTSLIPAALDEPGPAPDAPGTGPGQTGPRLGGTVHLTMPATTWLGASDNPGDIPGTGPTDADTCRDLASTLAANPATRWCITHPAGTWPSPNPAS